MQNSKQYPLPPKNSSVEACYGIYELDGTRIDEVSISWEGVYWLEGELLEWRGSNPRTLRRRLAKWNAVFQGWASQN